MSLGEILQNAAAPVVITVMFLFFMDRSEKQRSENAKALQQENRAHESVVFNLFATTMKQMITEVTHSNEQIVDALNDGHQRIITAISAHEESSEERYERNKNTQEILKKLEELKKHGEGSNA